MFLKGNLLIYAARVAAINFYKSFIKEPLRPLTLTIVTLKAYAKVGVVGLSESRR